MRPADMLIRDAATLTRPVRIVKGYRPTRLRPDLIAGLTVAVVAIPQSIAYAAIAGLPPTYGLYSAAVAAIAGSMWGSSRYLSTGPTNAISILVLSILSPLAAIGAPEYLMAASAMAVMVGFFCIAFGFAGLGMLVNFASRAVLLGFTAGAGVLIATGQLKNLLRLDVPRSPVLWRTVGGVAENLSQTHVVSLVLGVVTIAVILMVNRISMRLPAAIIALFVTGIGVAAVGVERLGVAVVGEVSRAVPRLTRFSFVELFEKDLIGALVMGALAVAALGLVEAISIAHVGTGQDAALVVDLVLQRSRRRAPRRVLRMREGSFDATAFDPNSADACQALGVLASELLERTHAIALPDDDGERSDPVPHFDDLEGYESEVLDGLRR